MTMSLSDLIIEPLTGHAIEPPSDQVTALLNDRVIESLTSPLTEPLADRSTELPTDQLTESLWVLSPGAPPMQSVPIALSVLLPGLIAILH